MANLKCCICNKSACSIQTNDRGEKLGVCNKHFWQYDAQEEEFGEWAKTQYHKEFKREKHG